MKKILGYVLVYSIGLVFIFAMMFRMESLDNKSVNNTTFNSKIVHLK